MDSLWSNCCKPNLILSFRFTPRSSHLFHSTSPQNDAVSTSTSTSSPLVNWLVNSLSFTEKDAVRLTKRRASKELSGPKLLRNADLVLVCLHQRGLQVPQIRKVISHAPHVLAMRVGWSLEPKLDFLQDLTLSKSDFADLLASFPEMLNHSLDSALRPTVETLRGVVGSDEGVVKVIKRLRCRDFAKINAYLADNIALLRNKGVPMEAIQKCMVAQSGHLLTSTPRFEELMGKVERQWGVSPSSGTFLLAMRLIGCQPEETIEGKCRVYESFGWGRADVVELFRKNPYCLSAAEDTVKKKLGFYMNELGYDAGYIAAHPALMLYSFEKRVLPRYAVFQRLKEEGLIRENSSFYTAVIYTESKFLEKFVVPYKEDLPDLLELYVESMGSSSGHQHHQRRRRKPISSKTKLKLSQ